MIETLTLSNFRNHTMCRIQTYGSQNIIITGPNGAGKTAILEAVSMLGGDKGLRGAPMTEILKFDSPDSFNILSTLDDDTEVLISFSQSDTNRKAKVNGDNASLSDLARLLKIIWITPKEDRIFVDSASDRRAFFDRLTSNFDAMHSGRVAKLSKLLSERAFALKTGRNDLWLNALDQQIASTSVSIAAARIQYAGELNYFLQNSAISVFGMIENILISGKSASIAEQEYLQYLYENRELVGDKMILDGAHKSDFGVMNTALQLPVNLTSTGQQKMTLLDIILAHAKLIKIKTNYKAIILLDEAAAHLDETARERLFLELGQAEAQVWATGIERSIFKNVPNATFVACNGGGINNILCTKGV